MNYSESDTRAKFIDVQLKNSNWEENCIIREYYFTDGRKSLGNKRGARKFADYVLTYKGVKVAIIEAKKQNLEPTEGLEQVKEYGKILNLRFVYSSNGKKTYEFDLETGKGKFIEKYPTPEKLYEKIFSEKNETKEKLLEEPFLISEKKPRYYQEIAINKTMEAIGDGANRILLTMATGTGKTVIAFQTVYKLFQARWSKDGIGKRRPRILFLADRNVLVDQAMNTFNPLEKDILKINGVEIKKRGGVVPTNSNVFFAIYQALVGGESEDKVNFEERESTLGGNPDEILEAYYNRYPKDFFDLIIIDECHRGGAREDGNWAEILKHFDSAVHLGLTATPKRDDNVDTYSYFGKPIYEYSLKDGIDDGFLTPFKIKRIKLNIDELVLNSGDKILAGESKKDVYYAKDMETNIIVDERSDIVAQTILDQINKMDKTIIFCADQGHALRLRDSINKYKTVKDPDYCVRVTSDEGEIGRNYLEKFQDNDKDIPVILTSSQMLTTGVDALNVRNIVLDRNIGSIVEYKQIVGRGTRVFEGKDFFTIYDFRGATNDFRDEIWDGGPDEEIGENDDKKIISEEKNFSDDEKNFLDKEKIFEEKKDKLFVKLADNREIKVIDIETRYLDPSTGKHLNSGDFLKKIIGDLPNFYKDENQLREIWQNPETRGKLLNSLSEVGLDTEQIEDLKKIFEAENSDIFDILSHVSFDSEMKIRKERSQFGEVVISKYENLKAKDFLKFLLDIYIRDGILSFRQDGLASKISLFNQGQPREIAEEFGGMVELKKAYYELQRGLYVR